MRQKSELIQTKEYMESMINSLVDPMVTTDVRGIITSFREGVQEFLGYTSEEMIGKHISLCYKDGKEEAKRIMMALEKDGKLKNYEAVFVSKDGRGIPSLLSASFLRDTEGKITGTLGIAKNISEIKRLEDDLKDTKDFLERILESSTDAIVTTDIDGKISFANSGTERMFGYGKGEVIGTDISQYYAGGLEEAKRVGNIIKNEGRLHYGELDFFKKDRTIITLSMSYDLLRDDKGRIIGIVAVGKDITEKNKMEKELKQTKDSLESLIEGIMDPMVTTDKKGIVTYVNNVMMEVFGYNTEIIGKHISIVYSGGMEEAKRLMGLLKEGCAVRNYETQFIRKDGSLFSAIASISLLSDKSGEVIGTIGICKDITERKRLEDELRSTKSFLESIVEGSIDGITTLDNKGNITFVSKGTEEMLGYKREDILGTHISGYYLGGMEETKKIMGLVRKEGNLRNYETALIVGDGRIVPISVSVSLLRDDKGEIVGTLGIYKDITERKILEEELKKTKDFLESVIEGSIDGISVLDKYGRITFSGKGAEEMLGYKREDILGTHISGYYVGGMEEAKKIMMSLRKEGRLRNYEAALKAAGGRIVPISVSISFLRDDKGEIIGSLGIYKDITENKRLQKELEKLSITDNLTGLYNQRHFYNELKRETERSKRLNHPLSLLLFDVDRFKYYNDTYGHLGGDKVLCEVGEIVSKSIRVNVDSGYRYGGDEFVVILPETGTDQAFAVAERIRTSFNNTGLVDVTLSIGLIKYRIEYDLETFVRHADKAMYTAKQSGGDRIIVHE